MSKRGPRGLTQSAREPGFQPRWPGLWACAPAAPHLDVQVFKMGGCGILFSPGGCPLVFLPSRRAASADPSGRARRGSAGPGEPRGPRDSETAAHAPLRPALHVRALPALASDAPAASVKGERRPLTRRQRTPRLHRLTQTASCRVLLRASSAEVCVNSHEWAGLEAPAPPAPGAGGRGRRRRGAVGSSALRLLPQAELAPRFGGEERVVQKKELCCRKTSVDVVRGPSERRTALTGSQVAPVLVRCSRPAVRPAESARLALPCGGPLVRCPAVSAARGSFAPPAFPERSVCVRQVPAGGHVLREAGACGGRGSEATLARSGPRVVLCSANPAPGGGRAPQRRGRWVYRSSLLKGLAISSRGHAVGPAERRACDPSRTARVALRRRRGGERD
ncbi:PREDICTED: uncharacterized protein LOC106147148 [Chinchilla lanigera]|uniref:uncharacterized protein LOC106147148 n=1 Tax=Chinchilla lanigera TaxID=34839 RepID=UPI000698DE47|nr:PREDICTED: uncharacterized protein LOC106147148 [Chinchilla lanigera]